MESDERPAKIRKLSHERDTESSANDVRMAEAEDAGAKTQSPTQPQQQADVPSAYKSTSPSAGTLTSGIATSSANPNTETSAPAQTSQLPSNDPSTASTTQETAPSDQPPLSKNALKKLRRQQEWDAKKADRKTWRKEKNQAKRERKREQRAQQQQEDPEAWKQKQRTATRAIQLPITFVIDCDFDDKMRDNERVSLAGQITRSYSDNKNAPYRSHLAICSFQGKLRERFDGVLAKNYTHWKGTKFLDEDFVVAAEKAKEWMTEDRKGGKLAGVFAKYAPPKPTLGEEQTAGAETSAEAQDEIKDESIEANNEPKAGIKDESTEANDEPKAEAPEEANEDPPSHNPSSLDPEALAALRAQAETIYLSSDSHTTLTELKPYSTYIIGGLVDKNREKGICQARADARGIKTARLPIGDYLDMTSRKVLATNHVNEIMLRWLECGDWGEAFMRVIPKRKGGMLKGEKGEDDAEEDVEEREEAEAEVENELDAEAIGAEDAGETSVQP